MNFEKYAGAASAIGLLLIGAIVSDLSKWQPLMAALIALGAGVMAYRAAMAKVTDDRDARAAETRRLRLSVCLRVDFACRELAERASEIIDLIREAQVRLVILPADYDGLSISEPPELEAMWDRLDLLPREMIPQVARVRTLIRILKRQEARVTDYPTNTGHRSFDVAEVMALLPIVVEIRDRSHLVRTELAAEIPQLRVG